MPSLTPERIALGRWFRAKRKEAGYTVFGLARDLNVSPDFIKKLETGYDRLPFKRYWEFKETLGIPEGEFLEIIRLWEPDTYREF